MTRRDKNSHQTDGNSSRSSNIVAIVSAIIAAISLILAFLAWQRPRPPDPQSTLPSYRGEIEQYGAGASFLRFLDDNKGRKVYIDAWMNGLEFPIETETDFLGARAFDIYSASCPPISEGKAPTSDQCDINNVNIDIDIKNIENTPLTYTSGAWNLVGYFAVRGIVSARMNTIIRVIVPIDLTDAVN